MIQRAVITSSALAAIGLSAMCDAAVKSALLLCVAWLLACLLGRGSAALRHSIWLGALAAVLVMPVLSLKLPRWQVLPEWLAWGDIPAAITTFGEALENQAAPAWIENDVEEAPAAARPEASSSGVSRAQPMEPPATPPPAPVRHEPAAGHNLRVDAVR